MESIKESDPRIQMIEDELEELMVTILESTEHLIHAEWDSNTLKQRIASCYMQRDRLVKELHTLESSK
jgi:hypothetical protein